MADSYYCKYSFRYTSEIVNLIIFQYVFSDMYKNNEQEDIENFIGKLASFLNKKLISQFTYWIMIHI